MNFEPGQEVYLITDSTVEKVKILEFSCNAHNQSIWVIEYNDESIQIKEQYLTTDINKVNRHLGNLVSKYETKIAVLKSQQSELTPLRALE